ncbi:MAG: HAMP domain-containing histidine kinase [Prevotella sp.]|nr:HAMP domain-containing histidine kinase [Prevotella sp.]
MTDDTQKLREELQQLREDYEALEHNFDIMSEGYQESLLLYDKLEETYHELEETNKQLEIARHRAEEASQMKTNFIQQISHEIRTPLNILNGFTQILTTPGMELDEAMQEEVTKGIGENTERITSLVKKMLELADANSSDELERNDDVPAVQIAAQAADESRITLATHLTFDLDLGEGADMAMMHTNLQQATRALSLLLDNAMKFTHPAEAAGGAAAVTEKARVVLRVSMATEQQIAFTVEDTGIGVPPEEAEHIFDEFVQLDDYYDGTGIGLTVARSIARRLGGDIVLDTAYSGGARFVMTLPL